MAIEDSHHGVTAAITAGMRCVAVRTHTIDTIDLSHASTVVDSLEGQTLRSLWRASNRPT